MRERDDRQIESVQSPITSTGIDENSATVTRFAWRGGSTPSGHLLRRGDTLGGAC
jgi:hypothetical protein